MESKDESKEIDTENRTCCYFDDIKGVIDYDFSDILFDENSYEKNLIYDISNKTSMDEKPLCIWFEKIDGFVKIYDRIRYLVLFGPERYDAIYNRIKYLKSKKSGITYCNNLKF